MVRVNGRAYGVVNLQRERVGGDGLDAATDDQDLTGDADPAPRRRELARLSADLVPLRRRRPDANLQASGAWPGNWFGGGEDDSVEAPTGRLEGVIVAFGPRKRPPPPPNAEGFEGGAPPEDAMGRRRRGPPRGGLVFEGQIVTEDTSGQVLARRPRPPHHGRRGGHGGGRGRGPHQGFRQGQGFGPGFDGGPGFVPPATSPEEFSGEGDLF
jgi:hypothetical protein